MGDRREIVFRFGKNDIYFYSHWCGLELPTYLSRAIQNTPRDLWDDPAYLMPKLLVDIYDRCGMQSVGITPHHCESEYRNLIVDMENKMVYLESKTCADFFPETYTARLGDGWTFEEFSGLSDCALSALSEDDSRWYH